MIRRKGRSLAGAAAGAVGIALLAPFIIQLSAALMTSGEIAAGRLVPSALHFGNFRTVLSGQHAFPRYLANSLLIAGTSSLIAVLLGSAAAFALTRLGRRAALAVLLVVLTAAMVPQIAAVSPLFLLLRSAGLLNTYAGLVIPYVGLNLPLAIWILYGFFRQLPPELEEAAAIDGAGFAGTIRHVYMPLAAPGVFTTAILVFIFCWNEFLLALTINTADAMRTVTVGIAMFPGQYEMPWGVIFAASVVVTLPLVALVLVLQRRIVSGLTAGAVKE